MTEPLWLAFALGLVLVVALLFARARAVQTLAAEVRRLGDAQHRLAGGVAELAEAEGAAAADMRHEIGATGARVAEGIAGARLSTARALAGLEARLETIDRAQSRLERLSDDVLGLQAILADKQARGAFGEVALRDVVTAALPAQSVRFEATLSNGRRVDCLVALPDPPGAIPIDAKFPLEPYQMLCAAGEAETRSRALRTFRRALRTHITDIADRYVLADETGAGALLFLPSEAIYAEVHAHHGDLVREGFARRVWIVSPTTCMATLTTLRGILREARTEASAAALRVEARALLSETEAIASRADALERRLSQAADDLAELRRLSRRAGARARRIEDPEPPVSQAAEG